MDCRPSRRNKAVDDLFIETKYGGWSGGGRGV